MGSAGRKCVELLKVGEIGECHHRGPIGQTGEGQRNQPAIGASGLAPFPETLRGGGIHAARDDAPNAVPPNAAGADIGDLGKMRLAGQFRLRQLLV